MVITLVLLVLQCFDAVGWAAGSIQPVVVICLEQGADLHMAQLMPLPLTVLASIKSRLVLPFWYRLTWVVPEKGHYTGVCTVRCCGGLVVLTPCDMAGRCVSCTHGTRQRHACTTCLGVSAGSNTTAKSSSPITRSTSSPNSPSSRSVSAHLLPWTLGLHLWKILDCARTPRRNLL